MKDWRWWLVSLSAACSISATGPPVRVELRTSWPSPPFFVEMLETLSLDAPGSFFPLLDVLTDVQTSPNMRVKGRLPEDVYALTLMAAFEAGYLLNGGKMASVDMNLALHVALPRVEAAYQFYADRYTHTPGCESWVDWNGDVVCNGKELKKLLSVETIEAANSTFVRPKLFPFDQVHPHHEVAAERPPRTAILYGTIDSNNFRELHEPLYAASTGPQPKLEYVFRHVPPTRKSKPAHLSGYGVALDLKKMEYLALDDRNQGKSELSEAEQSSKSSTYDTDPIISLLHQYPENITADYSTSLAEDELQLLGLQATQLLYDSDNALETLTQLSQNFPKYASAIARRVTVNPEIEEEVLGNYAKAHPGVSVVWLNGVVVPETDMNPFSLLRLMRKERNVIQAATGLGLSTAQAIELLTHKAIGLAQSDSGVLDGIFDASDRLEDGGVIVWWNDFENDTRYARWNPSLNTLLAPMYPGQFPNVRLNLFNIVLVLDLSQSSSISFISSAVSAVIARGFPFRFGVAPMLETENGTKMAKLFYWLVENVGQQYTMAYFSKLAQIMFSDAQLVPYVDLDVARSVFNSHLAAYPEDLPDNIDFNVIVDALPNNEESDESDILEKARSYARRLGANAASAPQGHAFVNGKHFDLDDDFLRNMQMEASQQLQHLQGELYHGHINDEDAPRMSTYFYDLPEASKRRNWHIYPQGKTTVANGLKIINLIDVITRSKFPFVSGAFIYPPESEQLSATTFVIADLDTHAGISLVKEVLLSMAPESTSRYTFIHNPVTISSSNRSPSAVFKHLIAGASLNRTTPTQLLEILEQSEQVLQSDEQVVLSVSNGLGDLLGGAKFAGSAQEGYDRYDRSCRAVVELLKIAPGEQALVVNGRVIGPFAPGEIVAADLDSLMIYEYRRRIKPVVDALEDLNLTMDMSRNDYDDMTTLTSSLISSIHLPDPSEAGLFNAPVRPRRRHYQLLTGNFTKFEFGNNNTAELHFGILLDPLSEAAQKYSSLIQWVLNDPTVFVELHIHAPRYHELPLKRFYRFSIHPSLRWDQKLEVPSTIAFEGLPEEPIYTLAMDVPPSWLVRPRDASHDLDNILLSTLSSNERALGVNANFTLDCLVIEGHAREDEVLAPPRGLQLQLVTTNSTTVADTLVVANLGYHQFRAKPGVYQFEIRPGRGQEIFRLASVGNEGWDSPTVDVAGNEITLMSFEGLTLYPRTARLSGMERVDVLASEKPDEDHEVNLIDKLKSTFGSFFSAKETPTTSLEVKDTSQADVNIFTVASGLLYERFASIMILSVLRNTNSTVKFWFIENFLSPSFLEFIPHFAERYGFQYELVTYKWPSWLRAQKEKQRIIWAYKILFLDVLFPMDLKKVIFVDADQIVRADLKELVDLDLHGAPYGYTPMGDDNVEMEGYRFWKTGYWKDFLKDMPYHISALYVVDLVRFRQMAAGDMLRSHYQQLSADPNSLANLDQDLPNNLQREVPIFSLPEDWLWCETWCSKDRLHRAKTIDLCQNPLTKEPKLARAKHIPEWEEYDSEIAKFAHELKTSGIIHSGIVDVDAAVLADAAAGLGSPTNADASATSDAETSHSQEHTRDEL